MTGCCGLPWWWFPKDLTKLNNNHTAPEALPASAAIHTVKTIFYIYEED